MSYPHTGSAYIYPTLSRVQGSGFGLYGLPPAESGGGAARFLVVDPREEAGAASRHVRPCLRRENVQSLDFF